MNHKPSKSAKKRDAQAIEALAKRLLELTDEHLAEIPLDDELRGVVTSTRNMTARSALRRQRLYLAKQLRRSDVTQIKKACDDLDRAQHGEQRLFHQAERWRDRLLAERGAALAEFCESIGRNSVRLEQLVAELGATLTDARERRISREIFRAVHAELSGVMQDNTDNI